MRVLLSIKPKYATLIFSGKKKYEFRRTMFKNPEVTSVVVYASSPIQKVIGEFQIAEVLSDSPDELWSRTKQHAGVSEEFFFEYFADKNIAYAIEVKETILYEKALDIQEAFNAVPPQSFIYLHEIVD